MVLKPANPHVEHIRIFLILVISFTTANINLASDMQTVFLEDIDSGTTSPSGVYRWMDVADQLYAASYRDDYNYTDAIVRIDYSTDTTALYGILTATNLKPYFAYQLKLVGTSGTPANESIGLTGRWWQEEWNGSAWVNGHNLNNKGDGSFPNPNDEVYFARRDLPDDIGGSPTGLKYKYTSYLVFDYFITDNNDNAILDFKANSSYHVLFKTSQRSHTSQDGPLKTTTFEVTLPNYAYDTPYSQTSVSIFGEWERLPVGGVTLPTGTYEATFLHSGSYLLGDLDNDGDVDFADLDYFTDEWLNICPYDWPLK